MTACGRATSRRPGYLAEVVHQCPLPSVIPTAVVGWLVSRPNQQADHTWYTASLPAQLHSAARGRLTSGCRPPPPTIPSLDRPHSRITVWLPSHTFTALSFCLSLLSLTRYLHCAPALGTAWQGSSSQGGWVGRLPVLLHVTTETGESPLWGLLFFQDSFSS